MTKTKSSTKNPDTTTLDRRSFATALSSLGLLTLGACGTESSAEQDGSGELRNFQQGLSTGSSSVTSVSELRTTSPDTSTPLYLQGYYAPGDGGEGTFLYRAGSTSTDDGGTVIVDASSRRWFRQTAGQPLSVLWFGAYPNNSHPTETLAAINQTIKVAQGIAGGGTVWFPAGAYATNGAIKITSSVTLIGAGNFTVNGATRILPQSLSTNWIEILQVNFGVHIKGIALGGTSIPSGTGGSAIYVYCSQKVTVEDMYISNCWNGILNDSSGAVELRKIDINLADLALLPDLSVERRVARGVRCRLFLTV